MDNTQVVDEFLDNIRYLKVVHHVPGRIRVKASLAGIMKFAGVDQQAMKEVIARIPGIRDYRLNKKAFSVVIEYDTEKLAFELWEKIGRLSENPQNREEVKNQLLDILSD
ncbi:MAG: hypothetical protein CSA21_07325 [Deltaproteobacteria bacterium]|nr:MAG: hypothetical protein CSA21_07325 [Deltaproteobacteria bacterium]